MAGNLALSGLASGVDTSTIVDQLMAIERQSVTRLQLKSSRINTRDAGLKDIQSKLSALKSAAEALGAASLFNARQGIESSAPTAVAAELRGGMAATGPTEIEALTLARAEQRWFAWTAASTSATRTITIDPTATGAPTRTINVPQDMTLDQLVEQVNADETMPVFASAVTPIGGTSPQLVLSSKTTGTANGFTLTSSGNGTIFAPNPAPLAEQAGSRRAAQDTTFKINGGATQTASTNVVDNAIPGVRLTFKSAGETATINVTAPAVDKETVKTKLKTFVDAYNAVYNAARTATTEKGVPTATSGPDALKGQLFNDSGLNSLMNRMRSASGTAFTGMAAATDALSDIGITTGAVGAGRAATGALSFDPAAFDKAWEANPSGVQTLVAGKAAASGQPAILGLADRFESLVSQQVGSSGAIELRLKGSEGEQKRIRDAITRTDERLDQREKRLRAQFAAMESALQASQAQQSWLSGQLDSLYAQSR